MAVIVKYVVERNGVEKMTFAAKSEADAYDKMLDTAEDIFRLLAQSQLIQDEQQQDDLALYLAQHKDELLQALGAKAKTVKKDKVASTEDEPLSEPEPQQASQDLHVVAVDSKSAA